MTLSSIFICYRFDAARGCGAPYWSASSTARRPLCHCLGGEQVLCQRIAFCVGCVCVVKVEQRCRKMTASKAHGPKLKERIVSLEGADRGPVVDRTSLWRAYQSDKHKMFAAAECLKLTLAITLDVEKNVRDGAEVWNHTRTSSTLQWPHPMGPTVVPAAKECFLVLTGPRLEHTQAFLCVCEALVWWWFCCEYTLHSRVQSTVPPCA